MGWITVCQLTSKLNAWLLQSKLKATKSVPISRKFLEQISSFDNTFYRCKYSLSSMKRPTLIVLTASDAESSRTPLEIRYRTACRVCHRLGKQMRFQQVLTATSLNCRLQQRKNFVFLTAASFTSLGVGQGARCLLKRSYSQCREQEQDETHVDS